MSESTQRGKVCRLLKSLHAMPVENRVGVLGTPDVNYIEGWIELKWRRTWPKRPETIVTIDHFTLEQRRWLNKRFMAGGNAWLLLQVQREWLLFTGRGAKEYVGLLSRSGLYGAVRARWTNGIKKEGLIACLQNDWDDWDGCPLVNPF